MRILYTKCAFLLTKTIAMMKMCNLITLSRNKLKKLILLIT